MDRRILSLSELQQALRLADDGAYMAGLLAEATASGRGFSLTFASS